MRSVLTSSSFACAQTSPRFILSPKRVSGNGVRTHANSNGKIPSTRGSEEGWTCDVVSCRTVSPTHYPLSYCDPGGETLHYGGQWAQHTTHWAIVALVVRHSITQDGEPNTLPTELLWPWWWDAVLWGIASPTHYPLSYCDPGGETQHHTGRWAQHTTHWAIVALVVRHSITQDGEPNTLPTELLWPWWWDTASHRTVSPTHYPLSYCDPGGETLYYGGQSALVVRRCIMGDSELNTLPTELLWPWWWDAVLWGTVSSTHYPLSYCGPGGEMLYKAGQWTQHTTHWAIVALVVRRCIMEDSEPNTLPTELLWPWWWDTASHRTVSPTHYPLSYCGPGGETQHHTGRWAQHTTHWAIVALVVRHSITQDGEPNTLPTELLWPQISPDKTHHTDASGEGSGCRHSGACLFLFGGSAALLVTVHNVLCRHVREHLHEKRHKQGQNKSPSPHWKHFQCTTTVIILFSQILTEHTSSHQCNMTDSWTDGWSTTWLTFWPAIQPVGRMNSTDYKTETIPLQSDDDIFTDHKWCHVCMQMVKLTGVSEHNCAI